METYAYILRRVAERIGCPSVQSIAKQPGVQAVYRITLYYPDGRACDTVATLVRSGLEEASLETVYSGRFGNQPLLRRLDVASYTAFTQVLTPSLFDKLPDQPDIPAYGVDLCLIERGAGSFVKGIIFSPQRANLPPYSTLVEVVRAYLPEALREIK